MPTIVIVGAGPGLGLSIAKVFGRNNFKVALIARDQSTLNALAAHLREQDIDATGFDADVMDRPSLVESLDRVRQHYGEIDILEYSPAPHNPVPGITITGPLEATVDNLQPQIDYYLHGAVTATRQVLTGMLDRGTGTLLYTTGASSLHPKPMMGNVGPAAAALRNWVLSLHQALAGTGVYAAYVPLNVWGASGDRSRRR
jgi:short-subunit dehydrogenase